MYPVPNKALCKISFLLAFAALSSEIFVFAKMTKPLFRLNAVAITAPQSVKGNTKINQNLHWSRGEHGEVSNNASVCELYKLIAGCNGIIFSSLISPSPDYTLCDPQQEQAKHQPLRDLRGSGVKLLN